MKLSEKIIELRKASGMTQEELASRCRVSRQSVSKWEADIALPETDKLLLLGEIFRVSMDTLLKDELTLHEIRDIPHCGQNAIQAKRRSLYRVFYKGDTGWKKIADTTSTSYTWTGAKAGTYTFTVRCVTSDGSTFTSNYDATGVSFTAR